MSSAAPIPKRAITLLACAAFASMASMRVCDSMLPGLARSFGASTGQAAYAISAYAVAYGLMQLCYGYFGDRHSKYRIAMWATFACTIGTVGSALAPSLDVLIAMRALAGATAGGVIPLSLAWIGDTVPYERRQATLARFLSGNLLGLIGGQVIGGVFADTMGWRWAFALLAVVFAAVGALLLRELSGGGIAPSAGNSSQNRFLSGIIAVLRLPWTRVVLLTVFLEGVFGFAALVFIPVYLHDQFGVSLAVAGAILGVFGLGGLLYTVMARRLIARLGEAGLALGGGLIVSVAFAVLLLGPAWSWAVLASLLAGLGLYMLHNTLQANATQMAPQARGTAVALFATALFLGQSIGVACGALVIDHAGARWIFAAAMLGLAMIGAWFARALRGRAAAAA
jgi:predicted MFS family arabinose efflux permease